LDSVEVTSDDRPDLTTIVVTWKSADLIGRCLGALCEAAHRHSQEIIVLDNGSDDGTPAVAARAAPDARIISFPSNRGFAAANNVGIAMARGRFVALVNSDCFPDAGALDVLVSALERDPSVGLVGGQLRYGDGRLQPSGGALPTLRSELWLALGLHRAPIVKGLGVGILAAESLCDRPRRVGWVSGAFCVARPEIGPMPDRAFLYGEDVEWGAQAERNGFEVRIDPRATAVHLNSASVGRWLGPGYVEARRVESALRWFATRGAVPVALERGILLVYALLRLVAAAALVPIQGRRSVATMRRFATMLRAVLTTTVAAPRGR
jgi:N-acetylglucosaminyl-diphospho-decaprenol L-rhamnosyltransferase